MACSLMKTQKYLSQSTRLLLITCTAFAGLLLSMGSAAAQVNSVGFTYSGFDENSGVTGSSNLLIINNDNGNNENPGSVCIGYPGLGNSSQSASGGNSATITDGANPSFHNLYIMKSDDSLTIANGGFLQADNIYLNGTLILATGGMFQAKTLYIGRHGILDLGGETLNVSAFINQDGTQLPNGPISISGTGVFQLLNGGQIINGTLNIDSTQTDAVVIDERTATKKSILSNKASDPGQVSQPAQSNQQ